MANALSVQVSEAQVSQAVTMKDIDTLPQLARSDHLPARGGILLPGRLAHPPEPDAEPGTAVRILRPSLRAGWFHRNVQPGGPGESGEPADRRDKFLGRPMPNWADRFIGGWDVGSITISQGESVFTVGSARTTSASPDTTWTNYTDDRNIGNVERREDGVYCFTAAQIAGFSFPGAGQIGASGRNAFRGPAYYNDDLSLVNRFKVRERQSLNFRWRFTICSTSDVRGNGSEFANAGDVREVQQSDWCSADYAGALRYDF